MVESILLGPMLKFPRVLLDWGTSKVGRATTPSDLVFFPDLLLMGSVLSPRSNDKTIEEIICHYWLLAKYLFQPGVKLMITSFWSWLSSCFSDHLTVCLSCLSQIPNQNSVERRIKTFLISSFFTASTLFSSP